MLYFCLGILQILTPGGRSGAHKFSRDTRPRLTPMQLLVHLLRWRQTREGLARAFADDGHILH